MVVVEDTTENVDEIKAIARTTEARIAGTMRLSGRINGVRQYRCLGVTIITQVAVGRLSNKNSQSP